MDPLTEAYAGIFEALAAGLDPPVGELGLPPEDLAWFEAIVVALARDAASRARRPAARGAFWGEDAPSGQAAWARHKARLAHMDLAGLRWLVRATTDMLHWEHDLDLRGADGEAPPVPAGMDEDGVLLLVLRELARTELRRRGTTENEPPPPEVVHVVWQGGEAIAVTTADEAAWRRQALEALMVVAGVVLGAGVALAADLGVAGLGLALAFGGGAGRVVAVATRR